jgi:tRNA-binding protein
MTSPFNVDVQVGTIKKAEDFSEADKPGMIKLWISLDEEELQSAAQLAYNHEPEDLVGRQVLCVTSLDYVRIAGFKSEALTLGVPDEEGKPVLVTPDEEVPEGGELY